MYATTQHALAGTKLQHGRALVLTGRQGCGKGTLARIIAAAHGRFCEISASELDRPHKFEPALSGNPHVIVVEGLPETPQAVTTVKALISNRETVLRARHGKPARAIDTPHLIFCTSDPAHEFLLEQSRRLTVIHL